MDDDLDRASSPKARIILVGTPNKNEQLEDLGILGSILLT
jgi:hypothetical protein